MKVIIKEKSFFLVYNTFKKILCVFLISVLFINGFIPKNQESKNSFITALNCALKNEVICTFAEYTQQITKISNKIAKDLLNLTETEEGLIKPIKETDSKKSLPVTENTSCDNGIIAKNNVNNNNILKVKTTDFTTHTNISSVSLLYINAGEKFTDTTTDIGLLFFILFAIVVVRTKDAISVLHSNKIVDINPTCLI